MNLHGYGAAPKVGYVHKVHIYVYTLLYYITYYTACVDNMQEK